MLVRLVAGIGLFVAGYYLGREVERYAPIRNELRRAREQGVTAEVKDVGDPSSRAPSPEGGTG